RRTWRYLQGTASGKFRAQTKRAPRSSWPARCGRSAFRQAAGQPMAAQATHDTSDPARDVPRFLLLFREDGADPALNAFGVDVHPIIRPVDGFRIPADALQILGREHSSSFTDVFRLENETVVKSKRQKLIQSDFLSADLPPRIAESLQVG